MLAMRNVSRSPLLRTPVAKYGTVSAVNVSSTSALNCSTTTTTTGSSIGLLPNKILQAPIEYRNLTISHKMFPYAVGFTAKRFYADQPSQMPSPPNLPDKQQLEKYFFRTVAFIWDITYWLFLFTRTNVQKYIVGNTEVQKYWKIFHEKMEKSKQ